VQDKLSITAFLFTFIERFFQLNFENEKIKVNQPNNEEQGKKKKVK
jgi:hypothetical protein